MNELIPGLIGAIIGALISSVGFMVAFGNRLAKMEVRLEAIKESLGFADAKGLRDNIGERLVRVCEGFESMDKRLSAIEKILMSKGKED